MSVKVSLKKILAQLMNTPMVLETGTSGIWTYRKWSDGTAECWGTDTRAYSAGETVVTINLPFEFANTNYSWHGSVSDPMYGGSTAAYGTGVGCHIRSTTSFTYRMKTIAALPIASGMVYFYIVGQWASLDPTTQTMSISSFSQDQMTKAEIQALIEASGNQFKDNNTWVPNDLT